MHNRRLRRVRHREPTGGAEAYDERCWRGCRGCLSFFELALRVHLLVDHAGGMRSKRVHQKLGEVDEWVEASVRTELRWLEGRPLCSANAEWCGSHVRVSAMSYDHRAS